MSQWRSQELVSEEVISDCINDRWVTEFREIHASKPTVTIGAINNRSHEYIDILALLKDLERELTNSYEVIFISSNEKGTSSRMEIGADFMLRRTINTIKDEDNGKDAVLYQINLELVDLATNQVKWINQTELEKFVQKKSFSL